MSGLVVVKDALDRVAPNATQTVRNVAHQALSLVGLNVDTFVGSEQKDDAADMNIGKLIYSLVNLALMIYAIYLSFKCNSKFSFGEFLLAFCCSPCYIAYKLAKGC